MARVAMRFLGQHTPIPTSLPFDPMLRLANARKSTAVSASTLVLLLLSAAATAGVIITGKAISFWFFGALVIVAAGAFFLLLRSETKRPSVPCWLVFGAVAVLMVIAVALPPRTSNDVWAYSIYGRIVTAHEASPYVHYPEEYPSDPYFPRAKRGYHNIRSVYGPVWTGLSAGVMEIANENKTGARLLFQGIAAASVLGALALLWRRTKDAAVLAFAGLNPIVAASVVNGGHNDALLGLTVLGGAFAAPAHPIIAGLVLGLGASIKIVGLLPLAAVAAWAWYRRGVRHAAVLLGSGLALVVAGYLLAGGRDALRPLGRGSRLVVGHSFWFYPRRWIAASLQATGLTRLSALDGAGHQIALYGTGLVLFVTFIVILAHFRKQRPEQLAGASLAPYLFGAQYTLPWYPAWLLPSLATSRKTLLARLVAVQSVLLLTVDPDRYVHIHGLAGNVVHGLKRFGIPIFEVVVIIGLVIGGIMQLVRRRPKSGRAALPESVLEDRATSAVRG